ncbi:MAG: putative membrane protein [bacterium]|jgi:uncharacterized membrane protein
MMAVLLGLIGLFVGIIVMYTAGNDFGKLDQFWWARFLVGFFCSVLIGYILSRIFSKKKTKKMINNTSARKHRQANISIYMWFIDFFCE